MKVININKHSIRRSLPIKNCHRCSMRFSTLLGIDLEHFFHIFGLYPSILCSLCRACLCILLGHASCSLHTNHSRRISWVTTPVQDHAWILNRDTRIAILRDTFFHRNARWCRYFWRWAWCSWYTFWWQDFSEVFWVNKKYFEQFSIVRLCLGLWGWNFRWKVLEFLRRDDTLIDWVIYCRDLWGKRVMICRKRGVMVCCLIFFWIDSLVFSTSIF